MTFIKSILESFEKYKKEEFISDSKERTEIMYEFVREPRQWTLERLDNSFGHNRDNVVISCLSCNLRRRTMAKERYLQTKAMSKIVKID